MAAKDVIFEPVFEQPVAPQEILQVRVGEAVLARVEPMRLPGEDAIRQYSAHLNVKGSRAAMAFSLGFGDTPEAAVLDALRTSRRDIVAAMARLTEMERLFGHEEKGEVQQ